VVGGDAVESFDSPALEAPDMSYDAGDEFDCPHCGGAHVVRRGKTLRVKGQERTVEGSLYVECPEAGFVTFTADGDPEPPRDDATDEGWP